MFSGWFGGKKEEKEPEKPKEPVVPPNQVYFCREKLNPNFLLPKFLLSEEAAAKIKPPAVVKTLDARLAELNEKEKAAYDEMVKAVGPDVLESQTGWTLLRYLIARNWDVKAATALLQGTLGWRKTLPSTCKWCTENPNSHMAEFVGWDKQHRPVIWMTYRYALERGDPIASEHHMSSAFDHAIRMMPEGTTQWTSMVDFSTFSILRDSSPSVAKRIIKVIADNYPERLGCFVMVNPIRGTWAFWKAIQLFIDEKTKAKVRFAYSNGEPKLEDTFHELMPPHMAKWLIARYTENYKELPLGALEGVDEEEVEKLAHTKGEHDEPVVLADDADAVTPLVIPASPASPAASPAGAAPAPAAAAAAAAATTATTSGEQEKEKQSEEASEEEKKAE